MGTCSQRRCACRQPCGIVRSRKSSRILSAFLQRFDRGAVESLARSTRLLRRMRRVRPFELLLTLVDSLGSDAECLADIHRNYAARTGEDVAYKADRLSRLPRDSCPPDAMRLYRENLGLKVQLDALAAEVTRVRGKRARVSLRTRASQVWAYLVTRGNATFQKYHLSASPRTIQRWATRFRRGLSRRPERKTSRGRPPTAEEIVELVITIKRENMHWSQKRISQELRRMGVQVSAPTVQKILEEHGFGPRTRGRTWEAYASAAKDALWALDSSSSVA